MGKGRGKGQRRPRKIKTVPGQPPSAGMMQPGMPMQQNPQMSQPQQSNMGMSMPGVQVCFTVNMKITIKIFVGIFIFHA